MSKKRRVVSTKTERESFRVAEKIGFVCEMVGLADDFRDGAPPILSVIER